MGTVETEATAAATASRKRMRGEILIKPPLGGNGGGQRQYLALTSNSGGWDMIMYVCEELDVCK